MLGLGLGFASNSAHAADEQKRGRETGLVVPRFVSLKSKAVNLRVGPGRKYAINWQYKKRGLPVEVIQEFDQWRRIRDSDGATGWVLHSLLSSKRNGVIAPWETKSSDEKTTKPTFILGKSSASDNASTVAKLQTGLLVQIEECRGKWCKVEVQSNQFWLKQETLWGAYPGEAIDS